MSGNKKLDSEGGMEINYRPMKDWYLWMLLIRTHDTMQKARENELKQCDLSLAESGVLFIVDTIKDRATPAEIARWSFRTPHSISELLTRMVKDGLVKKVKDLDRQNWVRIVMTEKGRQAYDQSSRRESIRKIMSILSDEEHEQLSQLLEKIWGVALSELGIERNCY